jgi:hypothetical protein
MGNVVSLDASFSVLVIFIMTDVGTLSINKIYTLTIKKTRPVRGQDHSLLL